jgi:DNA transformation protein
MSELTNLPNLGKVVAEQLQRAGIEAPEALRRLGSVEAAVRLTEAGVDVCTSKLSALEGAIRGIRWHGIPQEERRRLWSAFQARIADRA